MQRGTGGHSPFYQKNIFTVQETGTVTYQRKEPTGLLMKLLVLMSARSWEFFPFYRQNYQLGMMVEKPPFFYYPERVIEIHPWGGDKTTSDLQEKPCSCLPVFYYPKQRGHVPVFLRPSCVSDDLTGPEYDPPFCPSCMF
jgi:hypothetical protein